MTFPGAFRVSAVGEEGPRAHQSGGGPAARRGRAAENLRPRR